MGASTTEIAGVLKLPAEIVRRTLAVEERKLETTDQALREKHRRIQLERLEVFLAALWSRAKRGEIKAVRESLRVMKREADLLGLDAPIAPSIQVNNQVLSVTVDARSDVLAEIARLRSRLGFETRAVDDGRDPLATVDVGSSSTTESTSSEG